MKKQYDIIAFGGFYLDINASDLPFGDEGVPIEKEIRGTSYGCLPGGSGINFIRALSRLHTSGLFIGMRGDDPVGTLAEELCAQEGLAVQLTVVPGRRTNIGLNMIGKTGGHTVYSLGNANQALDAQTLIPALVPYLSAQTFLYMGTLYKLDNLAQDFSLLIESARARGAKVVIDHGRITPGVQQGRFEEVRQAVLSADYYLPSRVEFLETWGVPSIEAGLLLLARQSPKLVVVIKDGVRGAHCLKEGTIHTISPPAIATPSNLTGAGDTFNAGFLAGIQSGLTLHDAITQGHRLAAKHISRTV